MTLVMFEDQTNRRGEQRLTGDNLKVAKAEFFFTLRWAALLL